ncbi:Omega-6 fatty acid desaturase, endoplasmic reticulum isozyme 2 [Hordeum vulgare]|nr:Omega-6 fatty acid desaturase, endoplasmic reticulum isozyme 2 [Hordeum vulgare]
MADSGSGSFTSRSLDHELIPHGPEEEIVVRLALHRSREAAVGRQHSDSQCLESIASTQPVHGSGVAASPEAVWSVWRLAAVADAQLSVGVSRTHHGRLRMQAWRGVPAM